MNGDDFGSAERGEGAAAARGEKFLRRVRGFDALQLGAVEGRTGEYIAGLVGDVVERGCFVFILVF